MAGGSGSSAPSNTSPVVLAEVEDTTPASDTDILGDDVQPSQDGAVIAVRLTLGAGSTVKVMEDVGATGTNPREQLLFNGNAIAGDNMQEASFTARSGNAYNIQLGTSVQVKVLEVAEKPQGVPV